MPPVDSRNNGPRELTEEEVKHEIFKRQEKAKRARNQTKGGILIGAVGIALAAYSGLITGFIWMTVLGFVMALIGFGFINVKEAGDIAKGLLGRGGKD
jgi:hypothetical protein